MTGECDRTIMRHIASILLNRSTKDTINIDLTWGTISLKIRIRDKVTERSVTGPIYREYKIDYDYKNGVIWVYANLTQKHPQAVEPQKLFELSNPKCFDEFDEYMNIIHLRGEDDL